jgi:hypothetical protein
MPRFLLVCLQSSSRGSPIEAHKDLNASPEEKALAALANTQAVLEMYRVKEGQKRDAEQS